MHRLITTPAMEVEWINAVWMWRLRVLVQFCFATVSVALLVLSLARLLGIDVVNWPAVAVWIIQNYARAVLWLLFNLADAIEALGLNVVARFVRAIPVWIFDLLAAYVFIGSLVRLAEISMLLKAEKLKLDSGPDFIRDAWAQVTWRHRLWLTFEASKKHLLWPGRVFSDLRDGHYGLSPAIGGGLFLLTLALLWAATCAFG